MIINETNIHETVKMWKVTALFMYNTRLSDRMSLHEPSVLLNRPSRSR